MFSYLSAKVRDELNFLLKIDLYNNTIQRNKITITFDKKETNLEYTTYPHYRFQQKLMKLHSSRDTTISKKESSD